MVGAGSYRIMPALLPPLALLCMSLLLARVAPAERLDLQWIDMAFKLVRHWREAPAAAPVVIVGVDQASISASGKPFALMLDEFALALDGMRLGGARAVGVDLLFPAVAFDQLVPGASQRLALAIGKLHAATPLVLGRLGTDDQPAGAAASLYAAMAGAGGEGLLLVPVDRDGSLRRLDAPALDTLLAPRIAARLGQQAAPGLVNFSLGTAFDYLPLHTIANLTRAGDTAALRSRFDGKIVLLGIILPDQDRQHFPVTLAAWEHSVSAPGVLFQAQAVRTLMQGGMIRSRPALGDGAALLTVFLLWTARRRPGRAALAGAVLVTALLAASTVFLANGIHAPVAAPLLALALTTIWLGVKAYRRELAGRRRIRSIFAGYVSPAILDTILSGALRDGQAGTRQPLAFLFADIRGFTALCAAHPPEQVIAFLNRYYGVITPALHRHGGTIDKFSGDGIMVFFGAPQASANPARDAVLAALDMLDALARWNGVLAGEGNHAVKVGIGIAYGDAVLGNVGSPARHDYTATGAATTLAAHIQQYCKSVPYALLVEQSAFALADLAPDQQARFCSVPAHLEKHGRLMLAACLEPGERHI